ncbi:MAG TPA: hypothetical protein VGF67_06035 [Ktedonobacteraceae bacterium]|jgi:hypothetical protein
MQQFSSPTDQLDSLMRITDNELVQKLGDLALLGDWFAFLKPTWLQRSGLGALLADDGLAARPAILFRGQSVALPGATDCRENAPRPQAPLAYLR